jgi:hypothetical protein
MGIVPMLDGHPAMIVGQLGTIFHDGLPVPTSMLLCKDVTNEI